MTQRAPDALIELFRIKRVVTFPDLQAALCAASRATTFRYLKRANYLRSYNYNARYYTHREPGMFDCFGLYSVGDIHFSRDRTLGDTLKRLVRESEAGCTQRELQELLRVRVQVLLLEAVRRAEIQRARVAGFYLYLHSDPAIGPCQLQQRQARIARAPSAEAQQVQVDDQIIIQVLLNLIRPPGSSPAEVVRTLRGHSPPIVLAQVVEVFTQYDRADIGKKGGTTTC